ncbi:MAG: NAD(+) diphosphatase [Alphaproteobacteria bacterium]|nr:NAD(+) diphosphatase [Alphaproteobacteria bacterium]
MQDLWYTGAPLDRVAHRRGDDAWLASRLAAPDSRLVPVWRSKSFVHAEENRALMPLVGEASRLAEAGRHVSLLGLRQGIAYFALDLSHLDDPYAHPGVDGEGAFEDLREVGPNIPHDEGSILAHARGLMHWHGRHGFCALCGSPSALAQAGYQRNCTNPACKAPHFPRTDPAVIMLVTKDDQCLLGRTHNFRPRMYSTLAGFVEPGESLEEAVRREVMEEVGVTIGEVRYMASQPWPFPSSLMLGFHARALTTELTIDAEEMEDARWLSHDQVVNCADLGIAMPRTDSIAFRLIKAWLEGA